MGLEPGEYPFADHVYDLSELDWAEPPRALEHLIASSAKVAGVEIVRDLPVEIACVAEGFPTARFVVFWPAGAERMNVLMPKEHVQGRA